MKALVCGDRNWTDKDTIKEILTSFKITFIVAGAARGADTLAVLAANDLKIPWKEYPADWKTYGRAAGPIRNREQFDSEHPEIVLAFHNDIKNSKGTKDMINYSLSQGCKTWLIRSVSDLDGYVIDEVKETIS